MRYIVTATVSTVTTFNVDSLADQDFIDWCADNDLDPASVGTGDIAEYVNQGIEGGAFELDTDYEPDIQVKEDPVKK